MSVSSVPEHQRCCCHRTGSFPRRRSCWIFPCVIALLLTLTIPFFTTIIASTTNQRYEYQRQRETIVKDDKHHLVDDATIIRLTTTDKKKMMGKAVTTKVITQERLGRGHDSLDNRYHHAIIFDNNTDQTNLTETNFILDYEEQQQKLEPHDYGILFTHYHKTGYVLSRHLLQLVIDLEYKSHGMPSPLQNATTTKMKNAIQFLKTVDHMDTRTGERIAFGRRGNWNNNFVSARRHSDLHGCPSNFTLDIGAIHLQEAPDLFCTDEDLHSLLFGLARKNERYDNGTSIDVIKDDMSRMTGVKVVHLVRNPFQMAVSNYLYHSQEPTPEKWVHKDNPCETRYESKGRKSLASFVLPLLSSKTKISSDQLDDIVAMCRSLFRSKYNYPTSSSMMSRNNMENATFYDHLMKLNRFDGLRLATAQMLISSSAANGHLAGGDILRMGNNILKFNNLRTLNEEKKNTSKNNYDRSKFRLLTLSMDDYTANVQNFTLQFLDFVLGDDDDDDGGGGGGGNDGGHNEKSVLTVPKELRVLAAREFESRNARSKKGQHVTLGKHDDRDELIESLRQDRVLGPVLSEVEILVQEALCRDRCTKSTKDARKEKSSYLF